MDYNQHVMLFNNLLVYFDSIVGALYHSCSQTRFGQDCQAVEERLKHNLSKFSSLHASINCGAYISSDSNYNLYHNHHQHPQHLNNHHPTNNHINNNQHQNHQNPLLNTHQTPPNSQQNAPLTNGYSHPYVVGATHYGDYFHPYQQPMGAVYYHNNSEQDEEYSSQETEELSSTEADAHNADSKNSDNVAYAKNMNNNSKVVNNNSSSVNNNTKAVISNNVGKIVDDNVRIASFVTVSSPVNGSSRSTSPESGNISAENSVKSCKQTIVYNNNNNKNAINHNNVVYDNDKDDSDKKKIDKNTEEKAEKQKTDKESSKIDNKALASEFQPKNVNDKEQNSDEDFYYTRSYINRTESKPVVDNDGFILVRYNRRMQKARERRERILQKRREVFKSHKEKSESIKTVTKAQKVSLGQTIEEKHRKAEQKRNEMNLQKIKKAQVEEDKVKINSLVASWDAQSRKGTLHLKDASSSRRIEEVKARKWQQFALKDALFNARRFYCETKEQERRELIKSQSQLKLQKAEEARREKIESTVMRKEKTWAEKTDAIKKRKEKENEELKRKIEDKISQHEKRYEENLEQKRQKAFELSVRSSLLVNSENVLLCESYSPAKVCKLCGVNIKSEVYLFGHMQSRVHCDMFDKHLKSLKTNLSVEEKDSLNMSFIADVDSDDKVKENKEEFGRRNVRFIKKLKGYLNSEIEKFERFDSECQPSVSLISRTENEKVDSLVSRIEEAIKKETIKVLPTRIELLHKELLKNDENASLTTLKILVQSLKCLNMTDKANDRAFEQCYEAIRLHLEMQEKKGPAFNLYLARSSLVWVLVDLLERMLTVDQGGKMSEFGLDVMFRLIRIVVETKAEDRRFADNVVNYLFAIGIFEKLCSLIKCYSFEGPERLFLMSMIDLLESLSITAFTSSSLTLPVNAIQSTQFCGLVSWMYEMVFRTGGSIRNEEIADKFGDEKLNIVVRIFEMFVRFPTAVVQNVLGQEGISLQIRHLCSFLIWTMKCPPKNSKIDVILEFISHFTIHNPDNQTLLRCGASPTVLEQLVQLDISYFISSSSNSANKSIQSNCRSMIIPALIGLCYTNSHNFAIMCRDLSPVFITEFIDNNYKILGDQSSLNPLFGLDAVQISAIRDFFSSSPSTLTETPTEALSPADS